MGNPYWHYEALANRADRDSFGKDLLAASVKPKDNEEKKLSVHTNSPSPRRVVPRWGEGTRLVVAENSNTGTCGTAGRCIYREKETEREIVLKMVYLCM